MRIEKRVLKRILLKKQAIFIQILESPIPPSQSLSQRLTLRFQISVLILLPFFWGFWLRCRRIWSWKKSLGFGKFGLGKSHGFGKFGIGNSLGCRKFGLGKNLGFGEFGTRKSLNFRKFGYEKNSWFWKKRKFLKIALYPKIFNGNYFRGRHPRNPYALRITEWRDHKISSRPIPRLFSRPRPRLFSKPNIFETDTETFFRD